MYNPSSQTITKITNLIEEGNSREKAGKVDEAIACYRQVVELDSNNYQAYQKLAEIVQKQGDWEQAGNYYRKIIELQAKMASETAQTKLQTLVTQPEKLAPQTQVTKITNEQELVKQAELFYEQKKWQETILLCQQIIQINSNLAEIYKLWGNSLQQIGQNEEALKLYNQALEINPEFAEVYANIGSIYARQKNWQEALNYYQKAVNLNPKLAPVYRNIAKIFKENGQNEQSIQATYQASLIEPEKTTPEEYYQIANYLLKQNQTDKAISCLRRAIEYNPDFLEAYQQLAEIAQKQGNLDQAGNYYRKIVELQAKLTTKKVEKSEKTLQSETDLATLKQTNSAEGLANLGSMYAQKRQWEEAISAYQKALAINPKLTTVYQNLALVYEQMEQPETAAKYWHQVYKLEPQIVKPENFYNLGSIFLKQKKLTEAFNCYRNAIQIKSDFSPAYHKLGLILIQQNKLTEAKECFQQAIRQNPKDAQSYTYLGEIFSKEKLEKEATNCCLQAIKLDSKNWQAYHNLGNIYLKQEENWKKAAECLRQAIKLNPNFSWSHHNLGEVFLKLELYPEAAQSFQKAIEINPNFHWSYYNLGEALVKLKKWKKAAHAYGEAMKLKADLPYIEDKIDEALQGQAQSSLEEAFNLYLEEIKENPHDIETYYKALEIQPDNVELLASLGELLLTQKRNEEAIDCWKKVIKINPEFVKAYTNLATVLKQEEKETEADKYHRIVSTIFDWEFYRELYEDKFTKISTFDDAYSHWLKYGQRQKRFINRDQFFQSFGFIESDLPCNFDWEEYLQLNSDLYNQHNIKTKWQAIKHFLSQGLLEGRKYSQDLSDSWRLYLKLGDNLKIQGKLSEAILAYQQSIFVNPNHYRSYQHLGDTLLTINKLEEAGIAYKKTLELNPESFWATCNLASVYTRKKLWHKATKYYHKALQLNPLISLPYRQLKDALNGQWDEGLVQGNYFLSRGDRKKASQILSQNIKDYQDNQYLPAFTTVTEIPEQPSILLVVDDFLSQCLHYRVEQKVEQLKYAGFSVEWISWRNTFEAKNRLHFAHVVIFYRVPAVPEIMEIIAYAQTIKKVVFYEIDDLIFEENEYPDTFESYGGQIGKQEYFGLVRGTTLFKEAMKMCDYAIASTPSLQKAMEHIVIKQKAYLHRNALDSHNLEFLRLKVPKLKRDYISLFYGTGTKAHNEDFDKLVAPALAKILQKYPQVRLTIVGYLTLPRILKPYQKQIDKVDVIKDIKVYWEFLKQADINIAVLKETKFNSCKSELKWFEAASLEVPSVVSGTQTYLEVIEDGVDGLIARNSQEWYKKLELLVNDEKLRLNIAKKAYKKAWQNYNIPVMAKNIKQIIQSGIEGAKEDGKLTPKTDKIKLLIVNVFYPPQSIGGATRVVKDNVDILKEKYGDKYEVSIFTTDNDNPIPYQITEYSDDNTWVTKVSTPMQEKMDWQYQNPQMYELFKQYLEFNKPDLIHFHCVQRLTGSILEAAAKLKIPYCVTIHDAWWISDHQFLVNEKGEECDHQQSDPLIASRDTTNLTESLSRRRYLQQRLNQAKSILAVSETFTELYQLNGFKKTQPNRNGIIPKPKLPRQPNPSHRVRLAHVGGMSAHKGYNLLQQIIKTNSFPNLELMVIDHSESSNHIIRREQWNQTPVTFNGKIPQEEMYKFYSKIDVLIAASIWPESFGLVTREAAAAGVWVVASNKGALAEDLAIGLNGDVFNPENPDELTEILKKINDNPSEYQQLVTADVTIRTVEKQVDELDTIYATVLASVRGDQ
jgi:tetratricopeptide (TPR) repeat protein